jgi:hypothetical protein
MMSWPLSSQYSQFFAIFCSAGTNGSMGSTSTLVKYERIDKHLVRVTGEIELMPCDASP